MWEVSNPPSITSRYHKTRNWTQRISSAERGGGSQGIEIDWAWAL